MRLVPRSGATGIQPVLCLRNSCGQLPDLVYGLPKELSADNDSLGAPVRDANGSRSLLADSRQTLACTMMSMALLTGAGLNYEFGLWQGNPIAGLIIALFLLKEGRAALLSKEMCTC